MNLRTAVSIALIVFTAGLCFWLFVRPVLSTDRVVMESQEIDKEKLFERTDGSLVYLNVKEEVKEWSKILANFAPLASLLAAYLLKGRRRK